MGYLIPWINNNPLFLFFYPTRRKGMQGNKRGLFALIFCMVLIDFKDRSFGQFAFYLIDFFIQRTFPL